MSTPATHGTEGAGTLVAVWAALVALTATLVAVDGGSLGRRDGHRATTRGNV